MIRARGMALVAGALVLVAGACADTTDPDPGVEARELSGVTLAGLDDQLWVFGGASGPSGSSPPVSSMLPEGWGPNDQLLVYDLSGALVEAHQLPLEGHGLSLGHVLADGADRYLLGTLCGTGMGCGREAEPALFRIDDDQVERVELTLPDVDFGDTVGAEILTHVLQNGSIAWALQDLGRGTAPEDLFDRHRLLRIDLRTGKGAEVPLPTGVYGSQTVCGSQDHLYALEAVVPDLSSLERVRLHQLSTLGEEVREWELVHEMEVEAEPTGAGWLHCSQAHGEVLYLVGLRSGDRLARVSTVDAHASVDEPPTLSSGQTLKSFYPGTDLAWFGSAAGPELSVAYHGEGVWSEAAEPDTTERWRREVVVDGALYDAGELAERVYPDGGPAPEALLTLED